MVSQGKGTIIMENGKLGEEKTLDHHTKKDSPSKEITRADAIKRIGLLVSGTMGIAVGLSGCTSSDSGGGNYVSLVTRTTYSYTSNGYTSLRIGYNSLGV
jgi:hypothetical protein